MSHVPTVLKSDRSVFDKMLPVDDNGKVSNKKKTSIIAKPTSTSDLYKIYRSLLRLIIDSIIGNYTILLITKDKNVNID